MDLQFSFVSNCLKNVHVPLHTHQAVELVYYVSGSGKSHIGKYTHLVKKNTLAIIPAHLPHDQTNNTDITSICIGVTQLDEKIRQNIFQDSSGILGKLFEVLLSETKNKKTGFELITKGVLLEIQGTLLRLIDEEKNPPQKQMLVNKAIEIIQKHDGSLSVTDIASRLYISNDYLRHLFQEYAGQSPLKFILQSRIEKAKILLANKNLRIGEVAEQSGFENVYYFSRFFRKVTGTTPSSFQKKLK